MLCPARAAIWAGGAPAFGRKDSAAVAGRSRGTSYAPELSEWGHLSLHADAEPVLQFVQRGQAALVECQVPELAEDLTRCSALLAEQVSCAGQGILLFLLSHLDLRPQAIPAQFRPRQVLCHPGPDRRPQMTSIGQEARCTQCWLAGLGGRPVNRSVMLVLAQLAWRS